MTENEIKNWAFLSCSPLDNRAQRSDSPAAAHRCWGEWLQEALMTYAVPAEFAGQINGRGEIIPERIAPIFRDESELPEGANLSAEIRQALEQSVCLIVVCSPRSAQSRQVNEVVRYFKQLGRDRQILPIVVAGEPDAGEGNPTDRLPECFVPALRHPVLPDGTLDMTRRAGKSIFVDARHGADKREILAADHRHAEADLEMAKIQLIALLLGVGFNGLWWREQKRHFFELSEAQNQAREALTQVDEARRQLQTAQQQTHAAQLQALENQNLPRDVQEQIQAAQNQAREAQSQAHETRNQLQESQNKVRDTQAQLEDARQRVLAAEGRVLEAQNQAREIRSQLEESRHQARAAENQVLEIQNLPPAVPGQTQEAQNLQSQLEATRQQAQVAGEKFLDAQRQVQEFQAQAQTAQSQLEVARQQVREAQSQVLAAEKQARAAQAQVQEIQNRTRDVQGQIKTAEDQIQKIQNQSRSARRLTKVFALLAALALLAAGQSLRQRRVADQALTTASAEAAGKFELLPGGVESVRLVLQKIDGAEQAENRRRSLEELANGIPVAEIPETLQASAIMVNDPQRTRFQKSLLVRLGGVNPISAMTNASAIVGNIVNDAGLSDSVSYFQLAVLDNWMKTDLSGALNWVRQLPDADARQRALVKIIDWVQSQPASEDKNKALLACIDDLAITDVTGALVLAESLPDETTRSMVTARLWLKAEPFAAWEWINRMEPPATIMQLRKTSWPWTKFLLNADFGSPTIVPVETQNSSTATNDPIQIQPPQ